MTDSTDPTESTPSDPAGAGQRRRPPRRWIRPRVVAAATLVAGAAVLGPALVGGDGRGTGGVAYAARPLTAFADCDATLSYFQEQAPDYLVERVTQGGEGAGVTAGGRPVAARAEDSTASASEATPEHSTTNVAEAGVDEPDVVKTDGKIIVAVARGRAHLIRADHGRLSKRATLPDTEVRNVFLSGARVLVFSGRRPLGVAPVTRSSSPREYLTIYDIATLRSPKRVATLAVDGEVVDARLVGTQVRVATTFSPDLDIASPYFDDDGGLAEESEQQLREAVAQSTVDDWLPTYTLTDGSGAEVGGGRLVDCPDLARPGTFSGIATVAVSAFDLTSALGNRRTVGVVADGQQLYATDTSTYVTSTEWKDRGSAPTTQLHKFVTAPSGATAYRGSGAVPGSLLNQYAMSERDGVLRVATTLSGRRGWVNARTVNEGVVTTLREQDGSLHPIGHLDGLGREDNESIHAVRFIGDSAYVVTFRQTDPLYVIDLRDPAEPRITGELKIPGYSGYLHPIGPDLLLGAGQSGRGKIQFSLFDVSDPRSPRRIDTQAYGWGNAAAEFDPRAFLSWEPRDLVMAPVSSYGRGRLGFNGLIVLHADARGLREDARVTARRSAGPAVRSLVIGDDLYVMSERALHSYRLSDYRGIDQVSL